jgi:hypothetical protein
LSQDVFGARVVVEFRPSVAKGGWLLEREEYGARVVVELRPSVRGCCR